MGHAVPRAFREVGMTGKGVPSVTVLDHLVLGVPDLDEAVRRIRDSWGCRVMPGGRHPRWGSWNALVPIRGGAYLEIIAPHPTPPTQGGPRVFGLDTLDRAGLVTWAVRPAPWAGTKGLDGAGGAGRSRSLLERLRDGVEAAGVEMGEELEGSRRRPDGVLLAWRLTDPFASRMGGIVPFLMDWGATPHPSAGAEPEVELLDLTLVHPEYRRASEALATLGQGPAEEGPELRLRVRLATPGGVMELAGPAD